MAHLDSYGKGFQSEDLAKLILSKFCFIAKPSSVSDDLGSDFFCTLFKVENKQRFPYNSFAIQIKSKREMIKNKNKFEVTKNRKYIGGLEIPFFVGVADRDNLKLTLYAGEYICDYLSGPNNNSKEVYIELIEKREEPLKMFDFVEDKVYIKFPKVVEIEANYDYNSNSERIENLFELCRLIQGNIASKMSEEYIFKRFKSNFVYIYAGPGSIKVFEENFIKRLAEVFFNLKWLYNASPPLRTNIKQDFEMYKKLYTDLLKKYGNLPEYLTKVFNELDKLTKNS